MATVNLERYQIDFTIKSMAVFDALQKLENRLNKLNTMVRPRLDSSKIVSGVVAAEKRLNALNNKIVTPKVIPKVSPIENPAAGSLPTCHSWQRIASNSWNRGFNIRSKAGCIYWG